MFVLALVPAIWVASGLALGTLGAEPIEKAQQETGVWALRFLVLTLAITPLRRLTGWNELVQYRRMLGLFAFFYAALHLTNYLALDQFFHLPVIVEDILKRPWITIGMVSFLLLVPLAATSTKGWIRRLGGRRWQRLHRLVYLAAAGGALHFFLAVKKDVREPLIYAAIIAALLGTRAWWKWGVPALRSLGSRGEGEVAREAR